MSYDATLYHGSVQRTSFKDMPCSIAQCLEAVGEWWSLLIVRDAFRGITRFADLEADLGIARNVLNQRLARLVDQGVLERVRYQDHPPRFDYRLTDKGRDLFDVLTAMRQWGDRWAAPDGPPLQIVHDRCGQVSEGVLTCSVCGEPLTAGEVHRIPGPGAASKGGGTEPAAHHGQGVGPRTRHPGFRGGARPRLSAAAPGGTRLTGHPPSGPARPDRVSVSGRIPAPAHEIFLIVSNPARHVEIDGSGMLQAAAGAKPLTAVGQTFQMAMDRDPLGDVPDLHKYRVINTVTQFISDRLIEWTVRAVGKPPGGHVWGWQLEPVTDSETDVTNYCDWSGISDDLRARFTWPVVPVEMFERSIANLARIAATEPEPASRR